MTEVSTEGWGLPLPEELMPLTQTLISPALAAFLRRIQFLTNPPLPLRCRPEESEEVEEEREQEQEQVEDGAVPRMVKRPRLVWTPQLHRRFAEAVHQLGVRNAVPKSIMQIMNVDGLTRENVASHLQKYRLYLKRLHNHSHNHNHNRHVPPSDSPFVFPFPLPSPPARSSSSSSSANLTTLVPQHGANSSHGQFPPFFSTKGYS